ncbi:hypothetical protein MPTK2_7g04990 [Marchantia polymorpha subsp. ruderalis]
MVVQGAGSVARGDQPLFWTRAKSSESDGIVVVTAWVFSKPRQLEHYSRFYASSNWDSLICHPKVFNLWFPELAKNLALQVLDELAQELEKRPRPVVFATFSGGYLTCLWKIFQILQGTCVDVDCTLEMYKTVRKCYAGQIHDSSPADFNSKIGANMASHPSVLNTRKRVAVVTWAAHATAKLLDSIWLKRFEAQNKELWTTLYKSGEMGPIMVLCSKDDDIVPFNIIEDFCSRMTDLGCKVTMIAWEKSAHVDHFRRHTDEYKHAVRSFLETAKTSRAASIGLRPEKCSVGFVEANHVNGVYRCFQPDLCSSAGLHRVEDASPKLETRNKLFPGTMSRL